ncbi:MAG: PAS domain-containing sensor histidine kinase, partial [Proteobacteria bacterium]
MGSFFPLVIKTLETADTFTTSHFIEDAKKWVEISNSKMDTDRVISIFTDVTDLKLTQQAIDRSAERIRAIFENAHAAMFTFEPVMNLNGDVIDFRFIVTNPNFAAYVGQTSEALQGELGSKWFPGYLTNGVFDMYRHT